MSIDREHLAHIAGLARLSLDDAEIEGMLADLASILAHVSQLEGLDLSGVEPTVLGAATGAAAPPLRADEVAPSLPVPDIAALAPRWRDGHFAVPPVIDRDADGDHA